MKVCTKCKKSLPESDFSAYKLGRDGLFPQCKPCKRMGHQEMREKVKEREKKQAELEKYLRMQSDLTSKGVALPRTVVHQKWDGKIEQGYVRNDGLKHIKSRGV